MKRRYRYSCLLPALLAVIVFPLLTNSLIAQEVPIGLGSYNLSPLPGEPPSPGQWDGTWFDAPARSPRVTPDFNQIPTTHEWWSAFIWDPGMNTFPPFASWVYPYGIRTRNEYGFEIFKNRLDNVVNTFPQSYNHNDWPNQAITVGLNNRVLWDTVNVVSYGDFHCKIRLNNASSSSLEATMVNGVPFVYIEKTGPEPVEVWMPWNPIIDNTIGTNVIGLTVQGSSYGIFFPAGSTYTYIVEPNRPVNGQNINPVRKFVSNLNGRNYMVVAPLPDNSLATLQKFAQHAFVFVRGTTMHWDYDETNALLRTTFRYETEIMEGAATLPIVGLLPHHWKNSTQALNGHQFNVPRGLLKCADTDSFQIELPHVGLLPALPLTGNFPQLYQYLEDQRQVVKYVTSGDNYIGGKQIAKLALLTELADAAGHTLAKNKFLTELKTELELWLKNPLAGSNGRHLYYNAQWHTLTPYNGILGPQLLNDFHFSVGYILRGAATIAKFDPVWAQQGQWGGMVNFLIRGINNWDRSDTQFPFLRFHSPFLGHSHAGGTSARVGGAGQESSSEAINFAAAVFQWGLNTHQTEIRDLGVYLFLTEVETTKEYWYDVENTNFPPSFTAKHIWNVDGASHGKWTWFGTRPEHGLGINISLMNAHLLYLAHDTVYANELYEELKQDMRAYYANPAVSEEQAWQDVILAWRATFQADQVINRYESFGNFPYRFTYNGPVVSGVVWDDPGLDTHNDLPPAHFYHWIHALDSLGHVNSSVLANYSSYGVFDKEDCRHYVLYNPPGDPARMVQFTDGRTWFLPEDTTITYKWCFTALPSHLLNFTARPQGEQVRLDWSLASESGRGRFIIQRSDDGTLFYALDSLEENTLTGAGSQYYYIDAGARQGTVYYRIIYQETKGTMLYSEIRAVSNQESYQLYPNPTQSTCLLLSNKSGRSKYRLYQSNGIEVAQGSFEGSVELDMRYFASGMYIVWVYDEGGIPWVRKISKE